MIVVTAGHPMKVCNGRKPKDPLLPHVTVCHHAQPGRQSDSAHGVPTAAQQQARIIEQSGQCTAAAAPLAFLENPRTCAARAAATRDAAVPPPLASTSAACCHLRSWPGRDRRCRCGLQAAPGAARVHAAAKGALPAEGCPVSRAESTTAAIGGRTAALGEASASHAAPGVHAPRAAPFVHYTCWLPVAPEGRSSARLKYLRRAKLDRAGVHSL